MKLEYARLRVGRELRQIRPLSWHRERPAGGSLQKENLRAADVFSLQDRKPLAPERVERMSDFSRTRRLFARKCSPR